MPPPREFIELTAIARGYQRSQALKVAAELAIADLLAGGPRSVEDLAAETGTDGRTLYRLLRALASIGVFRELDDRTFELNGMADLLRIDHPMSVAPVVMMFCADYEWRAWGELAHSVRTGENAAVQALGMDVWEHRRLHREAAEVFNAAMRTLTRSSADEVHAYDFGRHRVIVDLGGGTGSMLASILRAHPQPLGILFDQPEVVAQAAPLLEEEGVAHRVEMVGGSFFEAVPSGADAYVLRRVLHDWTDEPCVVILHRVREAMGKGARLLVIDGVIGQPNAEPGVKFLDLMMLVSAGGRERTEDEWRQVLAAGGFRLEQAIPATATTHILVCAPA